MMKPEFLGVLREHTRPMHRRLELTPLSKDIISSELQLPRYANYLASVLSIHSGMERHIFPLLVGAVADLEQRRKVASIREDLAFVACEAPAVPEFLDEAFKTNVAFGLGMLYVTEGSMLGGQLILKQINASLGTRVCGATNFLNGYGSQTGERWKSCLGVLSDFWTSSQHDQQQDLLQGAVYAFDRVHHIFNTA